MDWNSVASSYRNLTSKNIPIFIFVTSSGDKGRVLDANEAGADDYLVKPLDKDQWATRLVVAERITRLHGRLAAQQSQLELLNGQLFQQARTDSLTGLHNRLKLREDLDLLSSPADGHSGPYCALTGSRKLKSLRKSPLWPTARPNPPRHLGHRCGPGNDP
ncbi:hypothetical protein [Devosia sp.]|uniref:hypothetical protein n=1 Tax=Devosia sp. TaxID=1871048 RepID=UPI0026137A31|nr:hypothetical protein [Devosia sp.]